MPIQSWAHGAYWYEKGEPPGPDPTPAVNRTRWTWWVGHVALLITLQVILDYYSQSSRTA